MVYGEIDVSDASGAGLFAAPAFFVTFRETLEAAIIIAVLLGLLDKLELPHLKKYVWIGVVGACIVCIGAALVVIVLLNVLKDALLDSSGTMMVEGVISVIASVLIAVVAISIGNVMHIHEKYANRIQNQVEAEEAISKESILFLSATAILREGAETIIFFTGIGAAYPLASLPIPAITGAIAGVIAGILLYRFGGAMSIRIFFRFTMVMLVFIGAGVFSNGMHAIQSTNALGTYEPQSQAAPVHVILFDLSDCCGLDNQFWVMMRVLFGYQPTPSSFEWFMYLGYHIVVWTCLILRNYNQARKDAGHPGCKQVIRDACCSAICRSSKDPENPQVEVVEKGNKSKNKTASEPNKIPSDDDITIESSCSGDGGADNSANDVNVETQQKPSFRV